MYLFVTPFCFATLPKPHFNTLLPTFFPIFVNAV